MTHHPNTPASRTDLAVEWLRNNYQDYPNIASLCDAMREALAASRTEEAVPSVASGVEKDGAMAPSDGDILRIAKANGAFVVWEGDGAGVRFTTAPWASFCNSLRAGLRLAAPVAALAARETNATMIYGALSDQARKRTSRENVDDVLNALASRQEAPAASAEPNPGSIREALRLEGFTLCRTEQGYRLMKIGEDYAEDAPTAALSPATVAQPVEGYEHYAAIREGHRNAAEDAWFQAIPNIEPRRAFQAGFDAGYNTRNAAQPCASQGCGGDGGEALKQAAADAIKWLNSWFSNHDGNKIADKLSAALSGLEHVGKEGE